MCIGDTFAVSYNKRAVFPWAQQQLLRAKPAYAWMVPRKWHQRKAGMELCHFLLALFILLRGKAILASVPQTANTSKLTQHHPLPRTNSSSIISSTTTWPKEPREWGIWGWKWRPLGDFHPQGPFPQERVNWHFSCGVHTSWKNAIYASTYC